MPPRTKGGRRLLRKLGPALVLASVVFGPGSLTLHTLAGSLYGYRLLWVPAAATVLMIVYTRLCGRLALVTGRTLFDLVRSRWGGGAARVGGVFACLAVLAFQSGNAAGVAFAADALLGGGVRVWAAVFALVAGGLIHLPALYAKLELMVKVIVGAMLVTFVGTLAMVGVRPRDAAAGLLPGFPDNGSVFLSLGILATTFSIVAAVYQGYLVREKGLGAEDIDDQGMDSAIGIGVLGAISIVVLLTSAGAIRSAGRPLLSAQEMALQLEPLAGPLAFTLFTLGFFFAAFSSLVINPLVGATLLADSFGAEPAMDGRPVKLGSTVILLLATAPVLVYSGSPIELLRAAQALAVVALPVLGYFVLRLSRDPTLMGRFAARGLLGAVALLGYVAVLGIAGSYVRAIVGN